MHKPMPDWLRKPANPTFTLSDTPTTRQRQVLDIMIEASQFGFNTVRASQIHRGMQAHGYATISGAEITESNVFAILKALRKHGWVRKNQHGWFITSEGKAAMQLPPYKAMEEPEKNSVY